LLLICGPFLLPVLGSGFGAEKLALTRDLYFVLLPILFLNGLSVLLSSILNAIDRFALATWAQFMTPLTTIVTLLWLGALWGIYALTVGTVAGFAIEAMLLARSLTRQGISLQPRWNGVSPALRQVQREYMAMIAGALLMSGMGAVDQAMAAMLDSGSVAALSFGNRIVAMLLSVAAGLWVAVLPFFSRMAAKNDWQGIRHTLNTYTKLVLAAGIPVVLLLAYFSEPIVSLLFERGAFTARDTGLVSEVQAYYFLQIPFYVLSLLMMRLVSSLNANRWLVLVAGIGFSLNIIMNYVFMQWLGVAGIALSTSLIYVTLFICLRLIINRLMPVVAIN
jgi:putative peptidoglycan lipid II flippase